MLFMFIMAVYMAIRRQVHLDENANFYDCYIYIKRL